MRKILGVLGAIVFALFIFPTCNAMIFRGEDLIVIRAILFYIGIIGWPFLAIWFFFLRDDGQDGDEASRRETAGGSEGGN